MICDGFNDLISFDSLRKNRLYSEEKRNLSKGLANRTKHRLPVLPSIGQEAPTSGLKTLILVDKVLDQLTSEGA